jgi:hypothetical protein
MYDVFYLRFHLFLIIQCCFHLHPFELRGLASDESLKGLLSSVFSAWRTFTRSDHLRLRNRQKRIRMRWSDFVKSNSHSCH